MAEAQSITPPAAKHSIGINQMMIQGRIERVSKYDGNVDHIVITPAADAYSKPSVLRIRSKALLGQRGEDVRVLCHFNGWPNDYDMRDDDGEKRKVYDARGFFVAIE